MSGSEPLRSRVQESLRTGRLPSRSPTRMWGGHGSGARCMICGDSVTSDELEYELEFAPLEEGHSSTNRHVHIRCFSAWEFERQNLAPSTVTVELSSEAAEARLAAHELEPEAARCRGQS
jgi:hypothetical protein